MTRSRIALWSALLTPILVLLLLMPGPRHAHAEAPFPVGEAFNTAAAANTDILGADYQPSSIRPTVALRVTIALVSTDSVVNVQVNSGGTARNFRLNSGTALDAASSSIGNLYTFSFGASSTYTYNFHCETATTVGYLLVEEIQDGVLK